MAGKLPGFKEVGRLLGMRFRPASNPTNERAKKARKDEAATNHHVKSMFEGEVTPFLKFARHPWGREILAKEQLESSTMVPGFTLNQKRRFGLGGVSRRPVFLPAKGIVAKLLHQYDDSGHHVVSNKP
jgi:hypothetical protein